MVERPGLTGMQIKKPQMNQVVRDCGMYNIFDLLNVLYLSILTVNV